MASQGKADEIFEYFIPPASGGRAIALGYSSLLLIMAFLTPLLAGRTSGVFESIYANPIFWLLLLAISPLIAFFLLLAFPPQCWRARLEIERNVIRYVPVPPLRWIGEPATALALTGQAHELLICRGSKDVYGGFFVTDSREFPYGFRVILRPAMSTTAS